MARTRKTYRVYQPALEVESLVSVDDGIAYIAFLPGTPCFDLIRPSESERVCHRPRVVTRPGVHPFWKHPRTGDLLFNRWWTREHYFQSSNSYYVNREKLSGELENFLTILEQVTTKGPFNCKSIIDSPDDEVIALLDSMAEGTRMEQVRRMCANRNLVSPPPRPIVVPGSTSEAKDHDAGSSKAKEIETDRRSKKRNEENSGLGSSEVQPHSKQPRIVGLRQVGPSDVTKKGSELPSVWSRDFALREQSINEAVNDFLYTEEDAGFLNTQPPNDLCRQATIGLLQAALTPRHVELSYLPLIKKVEIDRKASSEKIKILTEQNKNLQTQQATLSEENKKLEEKNKTLTTSADSLVDELKKVKESLVIEERAKNLAIRDKNEVYKKYQDTLEQVKTAEDQYTEQMYENDKMKKTLESVQAKLEEVLADKVKLEANLDETSKALEKANTSLTDLQGKYEDMAFNLAEEAYQNTIH
ncbi:hypothetical protein SESBI_49731 [Sesbania bispinosa]|nr:hypothetical protein SESBI_49731 [Sesbania bispinosa]